MTNYRDLPALTPEQLTKYLDRPYGCPYCGSYDLDGSGFDADANYAVWMLACHTCGRTWDNVYILHRIAENLYEELPPAPEPPGAWDGS